jgi:hypothetical protein
MSAFGRLVLRRWRVAHWLEPLLCDATGVKAVRHSLYDGWASRLLLGAAKVADDLASSSDSGEIAPGC